MFPVRCGLQADRTRALRGLTDCSPSRCIKHTAGGAAVTWKARTAVEDGAAVDRVSNAVRYWLRERTETWLVASDKQFRLAICEESGQVYGWFLKVREGQNLIGMIKTYLMLYRMRRRRMKADAQRLASDDPVNAYYRAQRLAARCRCAGQTDDFIHWSKVAAEIARTEPRAEMDFAVLKAINDEEEIGKAERRFR